jgi:hypothetical protein
MFIRWKAPSHMHRRVIERKDFDGIDAAKGGPFDHETVVWDKDNDWTADVADDVADYLIAHEDGFTRPTPKQEEVAEERLAVEEETKTTKKK